MFPSNIPTILVMLSWDTLIVNCDDLHQYTYLAMAGQQLAKQI